MGDFWGDFALSLGNFLTETSGHPGHGIQHDDTQHNDIQHNDTQHKGPFSDIQRK